MAPVYVDANIPLYATGADERVRGRCVAILIALREHPGSGVTSAEALQEVFHVLLRRKLAERGRETVRLFDQALHANVVATGREDVLRAVDLQVSPGLSARDRVHLAVMERLGIDRIISTDRAFDGIVGLTRLDPLAYDSWHTDVFPNDDSGSHGSWPA